MPTLDPEAISVKSSTILFGDQEHFDTPHEPSPPRIMETGVEVSEEAFREVVDEVRGAIESGVLPSLISQGSSGSYFCKDRQGNTVGVFKPKNEEPYGDMNPKWVKWMHRTFFPCCFGRSCLLPNTGYLSEAAASTVDRALGLNIVPRTEVVQLSAPSFNYTWVQRRKHSRNRTLPLKVGSFQLFVTGYKDAVLCFRDLEDEPLSDELKRSFRLQFERLVVLDYIIRNTDRGNQNWLIKLQKEGPSPSISLAAIDHGLAFPYKHPDNWRFYPFGWASIPAAHVPFSEETASAMMRKLEDADFVDRLEAELRALYSLDTFYKKDKFQKQMAVLRGQIYNLCEVLRNRGTPAQLMEMPPVLITQVNEKKGLRRWFFEHRLRAPTFKSC